MLDDAEWLLERTPQKSWGFMIRPIIHEKQYGLWIGEYMPNNKITREEILFGGGSSTISELLLEYEESRVGEREIDRKIDIETLRRTLPESNIIQDFKYFVCPEERFYNRCPRLEEIYKAIKERCGSAKRLHYSQVAVIISGIDKCYDVIICPLLASPNALERILIFDKILRSRKIGRMKIADRNIIEVS
ncbi:MAG: hypothetical protein QXS79_03000 [Candidatus Bathyarchaeia archaeon]